MKDVLEELAQYAQEKRIGYISYLGDGTSIYRMTKKWKKNAKIAMEQNRQIRNLYKIRIRVWYC